MKDREAYLYKHKYGEGKEGSLAGRGPPRNKEEELQFDTIERRKMIVQHHVSKPSRPTNQTIDQLDE